MQEIHEALFVHSFVHSFNIYLWETPNMPDTVLIAVNEKIKETVPTLKEPML